MPENKVTIGVSLEGVQQARQDAGSLADALRAIYDSINVRSPGAPAIATKPFGSPAIVPNAPNGLGEYTLPVNHSSGGGEIGSLSSLVGSLQPALTFSTGATSRYVTPPPDPYRTGGSYGPPVGAAAAGGLPGSPGGNGPSGGHGGHGGPIDVRVIASVPLSFANGGSGNGGGSAGTGSANGSGGSGGGGGYGGSGGGGGNGGASSGSLPPVGAPPPLPQNGSSAAPGVTSPYTGGFNLFGAGASNWASTAMHYAQNPSALMGMIPAPLALAGLAVSTGFQAADANFAAYRPTYDLETSIQAATRSGQMYNPNMRPLQQRVATDQGDAAYYEAHRNTIYGWAGRIGSLGIADWYYDTKIKPGIDRRTRGDEADLQATPGRIRFQALTGALPGPNDGALGLRSDLTNAVGSFGTTALGTLRDSTAYARMVSGGWSTSDITGSQNTIMGVAASQQSGSLYKQIAGGMDPISMVSAVLPSLIASGDTGQINMLRPLLGPAATDAALAQARGTFALGVRSQIDQSTFGMAGAQVSLLGATGAGYRSIASAIGNQAGTLNAVRGDLQQKMALAAAAGNTADAAAIATQIKSLDAQQAGLTQTAAMGIFSGRGVDNQSLSVGASNAMQLGQYGVGGQAGLDAGFGLQRTAGLASAALDYDMSRSPYISPEQRRLYARQATAARIAATYGVDQARSQSDYQYRLAGVGSLGAAAYAASTQAGLFGDASEQYGAAMQGVSASRARYNATQDYLRSPLTHISATERTNEENAQRQALTDLTASITQASRSFYSMNLSVAQTSASITSLRGSIAVGQLGIGGTEGAGYMSANLSATGTTLEAAQARLDQLKRSGTLQSSLVYQTALRDVTAAQADKVGAGLAYADIGPTLANRSDLSASQFALSMMDRAPVSFGNRRGAYESSLTTVGKSLRDLQRNQETADKQIRENFTGVDYDREKAMSDFKFQQSRQQLQLQGADIFSQYSSGWMDRLVSSQVNMPGRGAFVASQFTQREAAPLIAALGGDSYNGYFGFGGANAQKGRDTVLGNFSRFSGMNIGNINNASDFMATAMSGVSPGTMNGTFLRPNGLPGIFSPQAMTGTLRPADVNVKLEVTVQDQRILIKAGSSSATVSLNKSGNAGVIASLGAGAAEFVRSSHTSGGGSHQ